MAFLSVALWSRYDKKCTQSDYLTFVITKVRYDF